MSDHGEGLGDHGEKEHGIFVYREAIHVPLIVKLPGNVRSGLVIDDPAGLVDIFPTVLSLVGVASPAKMTGASLLSEQKQNPQRNVFSESMYPRLHLGWSDLRSLTGRDYHYIDAPRAELYELAGDGTERNNVIAGERRAAAAMRAELERYDRRLSAPSAISAEEAAKLAALGYVSAPSASPAGDLPDPKDGIASYGAYTAAKDALAAGDVAGAIAGFRAVLEQNPAFSDAALGLARAYEAAGQFAEAAATYRRALERNPALTEQVAIGVATALLNAGKPGEARRHAELALTSNPGAAHLLLARIALVARSPRDAVAHARAAAADLHYRSQATLMLAESLLAESPANAGEALRALDELKRERATRGESPLRSLEIARAGALMRMERSDDAAAALREEIRAFPQTREAYGRLAAIYLLQKNVPAAESVLRELVAADGSPASYALAAQTLAHFGQDEAASVWRRQAAEASPRR
jgi:tetratricopeptide (TPR) repeat protein